MANSKPQILLTNDDGILSPGLWAAAASLSRLGFVTVTAPRDQASGMGRSLPNTSDGIIEEKQVDVNGQQWTVYSIGGSPAQTVLYGTLEILKFKPDLVVSGINYGENVGSGVTVSGTVGAALEAASMGIPALAVSLQTDQKYHLTYSEDMSFLAAAEFTHLFASMMLQKQFPAAVQVLKVDVPADATAQTPWQLTRLSMQRYYEPMAPERKSWSEPGLIGYREAGQLEDEPNDTDVYALRRQHHVSVTPLGLDLTSRVDLSELDRFMRNDA